MNKKLSLKTICLLSGIMLSPLAQSATPLEDGNKFWSESKFEQAEKSFRQAIAESPEDPAGYKSLAGLMMTQNKTAEAITAYQDAIIHSPEDYRLFAALSIAYLHSGYYEMAKTMIEHALELNPEMKNAKDISIYIDAKLDMLSKASKSYTPETQSKEIDVTHTKIH